MFLGVDGGGTKTEYVLIDAAGRVHARHVDASISHLENGFDAAAEVLVRGVDATLAQAGVTRAALRQAFVGQPCHGEDSTTHAQLCAVPTRALGTVPYVCGNDMVCSWAGALAGEDGISVIAGTGSIAYGEYAGRQARAGGWGEAIGDEGSAYWIAREGLTLFARMSDGRSAPGPLLGLLRSRLALEQDLDLCAQLYGPAAPGRMRFAQFAQWIHEAALAGDVQAAELFAKAGEALAECVVAVHRQLQPPPDHPLNVSWSGGAFSTALLRDGFASALATRAPTLCLRAPRFSPAIGAALHAARLAGTPLTADALRRLDQPCAAS